MIKKLLLLTLTIGIGLLPAADFVWTALPYSSAGLIDFDPIVCPTCQGGQYEIDNHGRVFLRGIITCTVNPVPANTMVFTFPTGFRPLKITIVPINYDNNQTNSLQINPDGTTTLRTPFGCNQNADYISLEGMSFSTK